MKLLDKIKNMFTEEVEDDEVKVEKVTSKVTHVKIDTPKSVSENDNDLNYSFETTKEFNIERDNKPIFFDDNDFNDLKIVEAQKTVEKKIEKKIEPVLEPKKIAKEEKKEVVEKKVFKPTPIISPVYGVLDKNYHKEDIVSKKEVKNVEEPLIDSIRKKAYGTLEDELENTLFGTNSILFKKDDDENLDEVSNDELSVLTDDIGKELDELLQKKEKYIEPKKVEKKEESDDSLGEDDLLDFIDSTLYKDGEKSDD